MSCARAPAAMQALGAREGIEARLRRAFGIPSGDIEEAIAGECCDDIFDIAGLRRIGLLNGQWATKNGLERASLCEQWLTAEPPQRTQLLDKLHLVWAKADGEIRSFGKGQAPQDEDYLRLATAAFECCARLVRMRKVAKLVTQFSAGLRAGQGFALAYEEAKRAHGVVDFDDLIRWAEELLLTPGMGDWVRFKLDQSTDHILVDEAQDTNTRQWNIVLAIALEYFAGRGSLLPPPDHLHRWRLQAGHLRIPGHRSAELRRRPRLVRPRGERHRPRLSRSFDGPQLSLLAAYPADRRPGHRRSRPRGARLAATAEPARQRPLSPPRLRHAVAALFGRGRACRG
jgi:hypothetical protein